MQDREPTVRSRELGEGLRRALQTAGLKGKQAATMLGWSDSRVSRLLTGVRSVNEVEVSAFLAICGVVGKDRERLLKLCREQDTPGWLQQHGSRLPKQLQSYIDHENRAVTIGEFQMSVVPGLLQTGDYAREVIRRIANVPTDEVEGRVGARLARQSLLSRVQPPRLTYFIHEFALRLPVGSASTMSEQLHQLLRLAVRPLLSIRVLPAAIGAHPGLAGSFKLLTFTEFRPVVYLENETSCTFLEEPEEFAAYETIMAALDETALGERESREVIATLATELYANREDQDDQT